MAEQMHNVAFRVGSHIEELFGQMEKMSKCPNKGQLLRQVVALYASVSRKLAQKEFLAVATADKKLVRFLDIHGGVAQSASLGVLRTSANTEMVGILDELESIHFPYDISRIMIDAIVLYYDCLVALFDKEKYCIALFTQEREFVSPVVFDYW